MYTHYYIVDLDRFKELRYGQAYSDFNSHWPMVSRYREMLVLWEELDEKHKLTRDEIKNGNNNSYIRSSWTCYTLVLTIITFCKSSKVKKIKEQTLEAQGKVEEIEKSIKAVKEQTANNNRISQITEIKEKTGSSQGIIFKYLKSPKEYTILGYLPENDSEEISLFMAYLKEHNWLFNKENENYADNLYNDLVVLSNAFSQGSPYIDIHQQARLIKPRIEELK